MEQFREFACGAKLPVRGAAAIDHATLAYFNEADFRGINAWASQRLLAAVLCE